MPFQAGESETVSQLRHERTHPEHASTDAKLLEVVLAAEQSGKSNLVQQWIETDLNSDILWQQARGITLASLSDNLEIFLHVSSRMDRVQGWLENVLSKTREYWENHRRAQHWLSEWVSHRDGVEAWAAFSLMRRCADRRIYLTLKKHLNNATEHAEQWRTYLSHNQQDLENQIKKNEENMKQQLYGIKIGSRQVWPWLD